MIKTVPVSAIAEDKSFPYNFSGGTYPKSLLRSFLYSPDDPELCNDDHAVVMDYDGFIRFFPEWNRIYSDHDNPPLYADDEAEEYLPYHIGRTITPVVEVSK